MGGCTLWGDASFPVLVCDQDVYSKDDLIGRFTVPLTQKCLTGGATPPQPAWSKLVYEVEGDVSGEVLASLTMVPAAKKASEPVPELRPETVDATIEVSIYIYIYIDR